MPLLHGPHGKGKSKVSAHGFTPCPSPPLPVWPLQCVLPRGGSLWRQQADASVRCMQHIVTRVMPRRPVAAAGMLCMQHLYAETVRVVRMVENKCLRDAVRVRVQRLLICDSRGTGCVCCHILSLCEGARTTGSARGRARACTVPQSQLHTKPPQEDKTIHVWLCTGLRAEGPRLPGSVDVGTLSDADWEALWGQWQVGAAIHARAGAGAGAYCRSRDRCSRK